MEYLWSPWRMSYVQSEKNSDGCVFCKEPAKPDGSENLIVSRHRHNYVILNRYPYTSGHLMVVPFQHCSSLSNLDVETTAEMMELASKAIEILKKEYQSQGFNLGINIGEAGGAGIVEHIHLHIVPRWGGDTNFMSTLSGTRVLPESLEQTYERIKKAWHRQGT